MSRGGRGFGRGRGGFGASSMPPMGLTHADIQALSRDATEFYPVCSQRVHYLLILTDM